MSKSFLSLSSMEELEQWIESASPGEMDELKRWEAAALKSLDEINGKAKIVNETLQSDHHPVDLAQLYDSIISHNAKTIAASKTHPLKQLALEIGAKEKAIKQNGYIKRTYRSREEFKEISMDTFRRWFK